MDVRLVRAPYALHCWATAVVDDGPTDGQQVGGLLPAGLRPGRGWPLPDDLVGLARSPATFLVVADEAVVGCMGPVGPPEDGAQEIGYGIVPAVRSRGVSDRALRQLVADLFGTTGGVSTLVAEVDEANSPSWHLLERVGFERVGFERTDLPTPRERRRRYQLRRP